ncbi:hypothetical protein BDV23DRAFT_182557 [Aspergillus alliaceus]|uniref:Uncharacterized protein n=1 Tax=Petromyces alliaceus TaxID=209559 RepID=A0A5N7CD39_PETAA|nr:hypothetical protein BDV23DRAFT_182557 [Aspergillus alliaceus]
MAAARILANPIAFRSAQYLLIEKASENAPPGSFDLVLGSATATDPESKSVMVSGKGTITGSNLAPFKATGGQDLWNTTEAAQQQLSASKYVVIGGAGPVGDITAYPARLFMKK